jgi:hypothetical protein
MTVNKTQPSFGEQASLASMIQTLYKGTQESNAGVMHIVGNSIFNDPTATSVVSVYRGERPAYQILDELEEWLTRTGRQDVLEKIKELAALD